MAKNDDEDKATRNGGKNQNSIGKGTTAAEECDFVDEKMSSCCSSSSCSPCSSQPASSRARRNWSVFSKLLRETLHSSSKNGQLDSLILFDLVSTPSSRDFSASSDCGVILDSSADNSEFHWIAMKEKDLNDGIPTEKRVRMNEPKNQVAINRRFFRFSCPQSKASLKTLARGFDNTGNVRIWPGSEALAFCMLHRANSSKPSIRNEKEQVLELGAGFLGLTSFLMASDSKTTNTSSPQFYITDGNPESVESLQKIQSDNSSLFSQNVKVTRLLWGETDLLPLKFDTILAADCVFFSELHEKLLYCISTHLKVGGACFISSPRRKGSLRKFIDTVTNSWLQFELELVEEWNEMLEGKIGDLWRDEEEKDEKFPVVLVLRWSPREELKGALQLAVLKTADSVALEVGTRNGMDMKIEEEVVNRVSALVWETLSDNWAEDLARFAAHANRQKIQMDDVALLTRRNPDLFQAACTLAGINAQEEGQKKAQKGTRKRKKEQENLSFLQTPKADAKKPKNFSTSTPKVPEKSVIQPVFGTFGTSEITPIRPNLKGDMEEEDDDIIIDDYVPARLSAIQEEKDSFDEDFGRGATTLKPHFSMTNENLTSLIRQAENHQNEEEERLEAMIPPEEQFETESVNSIDAFFESRQATPQKTPGTLKTFGNASNISMDPFLSTIVENVGNTTKNKSSEKERSKKVEEKPQERRSGVFHQKISAFEFDSDDSFDSPGPSSISTKKDEKTTTIDNRRREKETTENQSTPKNASKITPKSTKKTDKANRSTLAAARDSFDEFDFDI